MNSKQKPSDSINIYCSYERKSCQSIKVLYYATFKVRKFESFFYKINTCLQETTTCIGLQAEQIFSANI